MKMDKVLLALFVLGLAIAGIMYTFGMSVVNALPF